MELALNMASGGCHPAPKQTGAGAQVPSPGTSHQTPAGPAVSSVVVKGFTTLEEAEEEAVLSHPRSMWHFIFPVRWVSPSLLLDAGAGTQD
jgi:hypothetical protein